MGAFDKAKLVAEITEIGSRVYAALADRSKKVAEREAHVKKLEAELAELKKKLGGQQ